MFLVKNTKTLLCNVYSEFNVAEFKYKIIEWNLNILISFKKKPTFEATSFFQNVVL